MQSVGQASTQSSSLVQVSVIVYAMIAVLLDVVWPASLTGSSLAVRPPRSMYKASAHRVGDIRHFAVVSERTVGGPNRIELVLQSCKYLCILVHLYHERTSRTSHRRGTRANRRAHGKTPAEGAQRSGRTQGHDARRPVGRHCL